MLPPVFLPSACSPLTFSPASSYASSLYAVSWHHEEAHDLCRREWIMHPHSEFGQFMRCTIYTCAEAPSSDISKRSKLNTRCSPPMTEWLAQCSGREA